MANAIGSEKLTVAGTALGFASIPGGALSALVTVETAQIRYWEDGSTPTSANGHAVGAGSAFVLNGNLGQWLAIRVTSTSAVVQVTYYDGPLNQAINGGDVTLETGDLEIGAVELKNAATDDRAKIATISGLAASDLGLGVTDPVANAALGITTGAAVVTDANGTIQQYLRGIVKLIVAKLPVTVADGDDATIGVTTGAKVVTDANGTVQQYLRGVVTFFANALGAGTAAAAHRVTLASDDPAVATLGVTTGAKVITDANGTVQQYLRGLVHLAITGLKVVVVRPSAETLANVASSATNVTLQASNASRNGWSVFNDSTAVLYVKTGATASATSYKVQVAPGGYYELPQPCYTGIIDGIWASANGNARVAEW